MASRPNGGAGQWVARFVAGIKEPVGGDRGAFGYVPGRLFDPGALRMGFVTKQALPWYSVIGPGTRINHQPPGIQGAAVMQAKVLQVFPAQGPGTLSGETLQQELLVPPPATTSAASI